MLFDAQSFELFYPHADADPFPSHLHFARLACLTKEECVQVLQQGKSGQISDCNEAAARAFLVTALGQAADTQFEGGRSMSANAQLAAELSGPARACVLYRMTEQRVLLAVAEFFRKE
jgi:hypothetical protein